MREYKNYCLFVTKETSRTKPPPTKKQNVYRMFLVTKSICESPYCLHIFIFNITIMFILRA